MRDIKNTKLLWLKAILFLVLGITSIVLLWIRSPHWQTGLLILVTIWAFCRAYYFAFYVIEHYIGPGYKFSGLGSFARHWMRRESNHGAKAQRDR